MTGVYRNPDRDRSGIMLTQLMISAGIMSILMLAFSQMQASQQRALAMLQTKVTRNFLQMRLQQALWSRTAMNVTLTHSSNAAFQMCTSMAPPGSTCSATPDWQGFLLLDGPSSIIAGLSTPSPARYTLEGTPCTAASASCPLRVVTQYRSFCPLVAPSCPSAQASTQVRFMIDQDPSTSPAVPAMSAAFTSAPMVMVFGAASAGSLIAHNVSSTSITTIPPLTCANAIRVEMQMDGIRDQGYKGPYNGKVFRLKVNGSPSAQKLEFGSTKTGDAGHGWGYTARGLYKSWMITDVGIPYTIQGEIQHVGAQPGAVTIENATYSLSCL